ncbi:methylated-DNA--[protein]-cysteine S-methyltransferase [Clostridium baratii]|uniref:methylated-DNA--[protein]-cysteine S-methyltransferase n=1 Tax=Clostridium baratii TaxID=1561 RepID=UPI0006C3C903|nr:methylated-DNA--[protein]-cysteine S-methyltransferase [Clostridium baratii]MDU4910102.1 methylated-DNA--[protein]-cysteine S-methyltransferase [Clostridium baratii]CUP32356.1 methylated-DNA--protein-cysteine methyltransferase [Clostridium baratii]
MSIFFYDTDIGKIGIEEKDGFIVKVHFGINNSFKDEEIKETYVIKSAYIQLNKYLKGEIKEFNVPLKVDGTEFMKEVWNGLLKIPYGVTLSYKELGEKIGRPKAARAIGLACNKNPIPIFIPCHRIVGSNGNLTGYLGGLNIKKRLLEIEKNNF